MQTCIGLNAEPVSLHFGTKLTSTCFGADICTWWKGIPIQWFSELLFQLFLHILAIDILTLIRVIDLSYKIIKLGKDRNNRHCEMLILDHERWSGRKPFPALGVSKNCASSGNRG